METSLDGCDLDLKTSIIPTAWAASRRLVLELAARILPRTRPAHAARGGSAVSHLRRARGGPTLEKNTTQGGVPQELQQLAQLLNAHTAALDGRLVHAAEHTACAVMLPVLRNAYSACVAELPNVHSAVSVEMRHNTDRKEI